MLASILEVFNEEEGYLQMNKEVKNAKEPQDSIPSVKKYEDLLKGANRKILNIVGKKFKDSDEFFDRVGLS